MLGLNENSDFVISRLTAIAGAIIGHLLVFYDSKRSIRFFKVFFTGTTAFRRLFDQKAEVSKIAV